MADQPQQLVQKLWNYCNILRDDLSACGHAQAGGLSYGDYPSAWLRADFESGKIAPNPGWLKEVWGKWSGDESIEAIDI